MAQRRHHYEQAFEQYLRDERVPYVAVNEAKKAIMGQGESFRQVRESDGTSRSLKSFDFIIYAEPKGFLLEVKGRKVAATTRQAHADGRARRGPRLESWVTHEDVESLRTWRDLFGEGFEAVFVFVYWCEEPPPAALFEESFAFRGRWYALRAIRLDDFASAMVTRSARWSTVHLPGEEFDRLSGPLWSGPDAERALLAPPAAVASGR